MDYKQTKVLIVDDARVARQIVKNMLTEIGFTNFVEAENGKAALETMKKDKIGLVLSDWNMPTMSGIEFLKALRTGGGPIANTPFIMVTAERMEKNIVDAVQSGVSGYIKKPFGAKELDEKIKQALKLM